MENITTSAELKDAIQLLEFEHTYKGQLLKEQLLLVHESLKPANLIKSAISEVSSSPYLVDNLLGATVGLASGYISRILAVGSSGNAFRKLLGTILQFGVTNAVAQHTDTIKSIGQFIYQHFLHKKDLNAKDS
ncbi:MAG: hypothetical protein WC384_18430 [Prolixibacteraceae bacterium]|jgi:hypothetical protein